jgi:hypothetical protein
MCGTEKAEFYCTRKEGFVGSTSQGHRTTERIYTYPGFENVKLVVITLKILLKIK